MEDVHQALKWISKATTAATVKKYEKLLFVNYLLIIHEVLG